METSDVTRELLRVLGRQSGPEAMAPVWNPDGGRDTAGISASADVLKAAGGLSANSNSGVTVANGLNWMTQGQDQSVLEESMSRLTQGMEQLRISTQTQADSVNANTDALAQNTASQANKSGGTAASTVGRILSPVWKATGIGAIVSELSSLFRGGGDAQAASLTPYVAPAPIRYEATLSGAGNSGGTESATAERNGNGLRAAVAPTVQVNVQAIDSRSFLDHSDAIASAVRDAMLRSHSLNDVVNEI
jgi:hypothetical protein